jgi:selenocysteine lyase/cysteine desulfurase
MMSSPFTDAQLAGIREYFPITEKGLIYMNHAAISPLPIPTHEAARYWLDVRNSGGVENFDEGMKTVDETRSLAATYINAPSPDQLTFLGNTSDAISAVAEGLTWNAGDEIILNTLEFPTNVQPFRRLESLGVSIRYVESTNHRVTPEQIESMITPNTRLVSVSAVQYLSGFRADLEKIGELCEDHDILFVVDAIQALGATRIDVQRCNIDALGTGCHKWLMSPMGIGFLYLSESMQQQIEPYKTGWLSVEEPWALSTFDQPWLPVSQHLETGTPNMIGIAGLGASLSLFNDIGTSSIEKHILYLTRCAIEHLKNQSSVTLITPDHDESRMGIVSFKIDTGAEFDPDAVLQELKDQHMTVSAREGYFRISPHVYNTEDEVETLLNKLLQLAQS